MYMWCALQWQVEDQHTQELLQADETENQLRLQLKTIQEELTSATTSHSEHKSAQDLCVYMYFLIEYANTCVTNHFLCTCAINNLSLDENTF